MSRCVVLQPSYIPWRGYFDQIHRCDTFVFYDDAQYDKHGWRNRNRIKTRQGTIWLTIPVITKGVVINGTPIHDVRIDWSRDWAHKHWETLRQSYGRAPHFARYADWLERRYRQRPERLVDLTVEMTIEIAQHLGIENVKYVRSSDLRVKGDRNERLLAILEKVGATYYLTGPSAREYLDEEMLHRAGIRFEYMAYDYPEYPQLYPPFDPQVSILDLLLTMGPESKSYIWPPAPAGHP